MVLGKELIHVKMSCGRCGEGVMGINAGEINCGGGSGGRRRCSGSSCMHSQTEETAEVEMNLDMPKQAPVNALYYCKAQGSVFRVLCGIKRKRG